MAANNTGSAPTAFTFTVNFTASGTYPIEMDYTESHGGALTLVLIPYM
jgi:hypothetical protein